MEPDYAQIGKRIAARRKELGLKQTEVCDKAGINDKYLSCIERATSIPSLEVVIRLAQALDTTPDFSFWWAALATKATPGKAPQSCCAI